MSNLTQVSDRLKAESIRMEYESTFNTAILVTSADTGCADYDHVWILGMPSFSGSTVDRPNWGTVGGWYFYTLVGFTADGNSLGTFQTSSLDAVVRNLRHGLGTPRPVLSKR